MKNYNCNPIFSKKGSGTLSYKVSMPIKGEMEKVWENATSADKIKRYFTTDARKSLDKPGEALWAWGKEAALINILDTVPYEKILLEWNGHMVDYTVEVEITFKKVKDKIIVKITESGWENDEIGIKNALSNCSGWSDYLNALKVFTELKLTYLHR